MGSKHTDTYYWIDKSNKLIRQATDSFCFYIYNAYNLPEHNDSRFPPETRITAYCHESYNDT